MQNQNQSRATADDMADDMADGYASDSGIPKPTLTRAPVPLRPGVDETGVRLASPWAGSTIPFPRRTRDGEPRRHSSPPAKPHKNLLGPVQDVMGTLLQRSVKVGFGDMVCSGWVQMRMLFVASTRVVRRQRSRGGDVTSIHSFD